MDWKGNTNVFSFLPNKNKNTCKGFWKSDIEKLKKPLL